MVHLMPIFDGVLWFVPTRFCLRIIGNKVFNALVSKWITTDVISNLQKWQQLVQIYRPCSDRVCKSYIFSMVTTHSVRY
jgi:hypothetical protein